MSQSVSDRHSPIRRPLWLAGILGAALLMFAVRFGVRAYQVQTIANLPHVGLGFVNRLSSPYYCRQPDLVDRIVMSFGFVEGVHLSLSAVDTPAEAAHVVWCVSGLTEIKDVTLLGNFVSDSDLARLRSLQSLESLDLGCPNVTAKGIAHLRALPNLRELNLRYLSLDDDGMRAVAGLSNLELLNLSSSTFSDSGIRHLSAMTRLRNLNLDQTSITDAGLMELRKIPSLRELSLSDTQVTDAGVEALQRALPGLSVTDD